MSAQEEKKQLSELFRRNVAKVTSVTSQNSRCGSDDASTAYGKQSEAKKPQKYNKKSKTASPRITLRLTEQEHAQLKYLSEGMAVSAYIRKCIFGDKATRRKRRSYIPVQDQESMAKALALLGQSRIANNLNQLAHRANMESLIMDETTLAKINEAYAHVISMRETLIRALGLIERA